jgi:hypothetical protein
MLSFIGSAPLILKRQELKVMLYTAEDAIQIYHAKSSTLEFFAAKVPKAAWQGIRKEDIEPAQEYYSDDIIVDFYYIHFFICVKFSIFKYQLEKNYSLLTKILFPPFLQV